MVNIIGLPADENGLLAAFDIGYHLAKHVTCDVFKDYDSVTLEAEYVAWGYILWPRTRKRYISRKFESPTQLVAKIDTKGVELARRDQPSVLLDTYRAVLETMMPITRSRPLHPQEIGIAIIPIIQRRIELIANDKLPLDAYTISKSVRKLESYSNHQSLAQCRVMIKRNLRVQRGLDKRPPVMAGERITIVQIVLPGSKCPTKSGKGLRSFECAEDPWWVQKNPNRWIVDRAHYLHRMICPMMKLIYYCDSRTKRLVKESFEYAILHVEAVIGHIREQSVRMSSTERDQTFKCPNKASAFTNLPGHEQSNLITGMFVNKCAKRPRIDKSTSKKRTKKKVKQQNTLKGWLQQLN